MMERLEKLSDRRICQMQAVRRMMQNIRGILH